MIELLIACITFTGIQVENCMPIVDHIVDTNEMVVEEDIPRLIEHKWFSKDSPVQDYVEYAYLVWGMELVTLIECENWQWNPNRISKTNDYWLCGINPRWHKLPDNWSDPFTQIWYCNEKYRWWTKFYWPNRKIKWIPCKDYVKDRFYFEQ